MPSSAVPQERTRRAVWWIGLLLVAVMCGTPLFVSLGQWDMRSDEAIYSYAVQRIVTNGNWMTPKAIPGDGPFFEKPPLKFWIVAAAMKWGGLPRTDFGMRFFDALFGAVAFVYVYLIGCRLSGVVCGVVSSFVLFTMAPLVFDHGLRSNNMEAAVVLGYCGGLYHWLRWVEGDSRVRAHAVAVAGYFLLAFMTKLVAAFFLPAIGVVALFWGGPGLSRLRRGWRDVLVASAVVVLVGSPWFIYHSMNRSAAEFWHVLIGVHVMTRFTKYLDPTHLHPWHYYVTATWFEVGRAGSQILVALGLVRLVVAAARHESWLSRLVIVWAVLPVVAISFGTSKLLHYDYPFWPPIALAAGLAAATLVRLDLVAVPIQALRARSEAGLALRAGGVLLLLLLLPVNAYVEELAETGRVDHPLRAIRDCMNPIRVARVPTGSGVYVASGNVLHHAYYYYFRRQGLWTIAPSFSKKEAADRVRMPGAQTPVVLLRADYERLYDPLSPAGTRPDGPERTVPLTVEPLAWSDRDGVAVESDVVMLLPGPYAQCVQPALDAGARPLWRPEFAPKP